MKRIILTVGNLGSDNGARPMTAEESWYWRRNERDIAETGFWVQGSGRGIALMEFFLPRELTELIDAPEHWTGKQLKISDRLKDWAYVDSLDCSRFDGRWPRDEKDIMSMYNGKITTPEIHTHQITLLHGWAKLVSCWLNDSITAIAWQLPWWEKYLTEEMADYTWMYQQLKQHGVVAVLDNPVDGRNFLKYLKTASCCFEIISGVCPTVEAILKFDRGQSYPCLYAGYLWLKNHRLGSWQKAKAAA